MVSPRCEFYAGGFEETTQIDVRASEPAKNATSHPAAGDRRGFLAGG
jgi:hypothetical protein